MAKSETVSVVHSDDVDELLKIVTDRNRPKSVKQAALDKIRAIEKATGVRRYGSYNGASRNPSEMARVEEENTYPDGRCEFFDMS